MYFFLQKGAAMKVSIWDGHFTRNELPYILKVKEILIDFPDI